MVDGIENEVDQRDFVTSGTLDWQHVRSRFRLGLFFAHRIDLRVVLLIYGEINIMRDEFSRRLWHPT